MKRKKLLSMVVSSALILSLTAGCGTNNNTAKNNTSSSKNSETVKITMLNSKGEIQSQLEDAAKAFTKENPNITINVIPASAGQSPFEKISSMYAAGNAPTLAMLDPGDVAKFKDKFLDLSNEKWVADTTDGALNVAKVDGKIIAFPFSVEGYGFIYNKIVLDKAFGGNFDPKSIKTRNDLENAFKKVEATGAKALEISPMDWSLAGHFLPIVYAD